MQQLANSLLHRYLTWTWMRDEEGQALAEYGLLVALIAVFCIAAVTLFGIQVAAIMGPLP